MNKQNRDPFDLKSLLIPDEVQALARVPAKIQKRREQFVMVPMLWYEALNGAHASSYRVALHLLHLHWKDGGGSIDLANEMLKVDGVSRQSKWRALGDLERRGLITVERRRRHSPTIRLKAVTPVGHTRLARGA
jgi:hypothetical protein